MNHIQLFETLPPGYRERAILRFKEKSSFYGRGNPTTLSSALGDGFSWTRTKEGYHFWSALQEWSVGIREIPTLPPIS